MAYTTIDDPTAYFQTVLYSGTGSSQSITYDGNSDMQPDFLWFKRRDTTANHRAVDSVRGNTKGMNPNQTNAEDTLTDQVTAFNSDGFSLGDGSQGYTNTSGGTFVSWGWKAGGTAVSNTVGDIASTVSANTTAGFSIVSYTGNGSASQTVGHGLGSTVDMVIVKDRSRAGENWVIYHKSLGKDKLLLFNTDAEATSSNYWGTATPNSTVFGVQSGNTSNNWSGDTFIAYCFAEKKGYSKFGSYTGNGNADGTFVYTGFKPAFVMYKVSSTTSDWYIQDNKRLTYNVNNTRLEANNSDAEVTGAAEWLEN
jgi:hypothetical protein